MSSVYGVFSDVHLHRWTTFSTTLPNGLNSRLQASFNEIKRCAREVKKAGGNLLICGGDTFHVRGSVSPEVLNPAMDLFKGLIDDRFEIVFISGNHDLASKDSNRLSSAVTALEGLGCKIINEPCSIGDKSFVPWYADIGELKSKIESLCDGEQGSRDLFIHAPVNGVIFGISDHGLDAAYLADLGFRRVFAGHFHNHKDFGNGVYSIGALTPLTWSDVNSKAGFLIVNDDEVKWFKSHAPEFIELTEDMNPDDVPLLVDGNFVRAKVSTTKSQEINELREWLESCGAKGVLIQSVKAPTKAREGSVTHSIKAGASIETSIAEYVKTQTFDHAEQVQIECQKLLAELEV